MRRLWDSQQKAVSSGDVPLGTVVRPERYEFLVADVRFDPTATADTLSSGLLAEGFPVLAADAQSPLLVLEAGATTISAYVGLARAWFMGNTWSGGRL